MISYVYQPPIAAPDLAVETTLPALRGLKDLADCQPVICIDTREIQPLIFTRLKSVVAMLHTGDYSVRGLEDSFAVERKSIDDLASCCVGANRERFERELHRLRGYRFARLLIVGTREDIAVGRYHSKIAPKSVLATLGAFEVRYDLPVVFCATPAEAAEQIERWAWWASREVTEEANQLLRGCSL